MVWVWGLGFGFLGMVERDFSYFLFYLETLGELEISFDIGLKQPEHREGSRWSDFSLDEVRAGKIVEHSRVFSEKKKFGNFPR